MRKGCAVRFQGTAPFGSMPVKDVCSMACVEGRVSTATGVRLLFAPYVCLSQVAIPSSTCTFDARSTPHDRNQRHRGVPLRFPRAGKEPGIGSTHAVCYLVWLFTEDPFWSGRRTTPTTPRATRIARSHMHTHVRHRCQVCP